MISSDTPGTGIAPGQSALRIPPLNRAMLAAISALYFVVALGWSAAGRSDLANSRAAAISAVLALSVALIIAIINGQRFDDRQTRISWSVLAGGIGAFAAVEIASLTVLVSERVDLWRPLINAWLQFVGSASILLAVYWLSTQPRDRAKFAENLAGLCALALSASTAVLLLIHLGGHELPTRWNLLPVLLALALLLTSAVIALNNSRIDHNSVSVGWSGIVLMTVTLGSSITAVDYGFVEEAPGWIALGRWIVPVAALGLCAASQLTAGDGHRLDVIPGNVGNVIPWIGCTALFAAAVVTWITSPSIAPDLAVAATIALALLIGRQALSLRAHAAEVNLLRYSTAELQRIANIDMLTGLPNRAALERRYAEEFERASRYDQPLTVLFADIDHFKKINDSLGHAAGDRLLAEIAQRLRTTARSIDFVARYGGEEFVVVAPGTWSADALILAERLRTAVEGMDHLASGRPDPTTISIGIAGFPEHTNDRGLLMERADAALYHAKSGGRNRTVLFGQPASEPS